MSEIFDKQKTYKIEKRIAGDKSFFYTGQVLAEDDNLIRIVTRLDGELIINKSEIKGSWEVNPNGN